MTTDKIIINRAPVLTLWAAVVAERLGYDHDVALTLGKGVTGLTAQSKGRRLGIFNAPEGDAVPRSEPAEGEMQDVVRFSVRHFAAINFLRRSAPNR